MDMKLKIPIENLIEPSQYLLNYNHISDLSYIKTFQNQ